MNLLMVMVSLPVSLIRIPYTGFSWLYLVHFGASLIAIVLFLRRQTLNFDLMANFVIVMTTLIAMMAPVTFGIMQGSEAIIILALVFTVVLKGLQAGILLLAFYVGYFLLIFALFRTGMLVYTLDLERYVLSPLGWFNSLVAVIVAGVNVLVTATSLLGWLKLQGQELEKLQNKLMYSRTLDEVCNLPTHRTANEMFDMALAMARETDQQMGVILVQVPLHRIRAEHGSQAADVFLKLSAGRIKALVQFSDRLCLISNDKFLLIVNQMGDWQGLSELLRVNLKAAIPFGDQPMAFECLVAASRYPEDGHTMQELRQTAEDRLFAIKSEAGLGFEDETRSSHSF